MLCNQCKVEKDIKQFMKKDKQMKTCSTCREKGYRAFMKNKDVNEQTNKTWKLHNKEYIKRMNEFYRTTTTYSKEDRLLLKNTIKFPNPNEMHYEKNGIIGKDCNLPRCGFKPLSYFYSNDFTSDSLSITCIRCFHIRSSIRAIICSDIKNKLEKFLQHEKSVKDTVHPFLGCSIKDFKQHLESLFTNGMSWEKFGYYYDGRKLGIHIDHVFPISCFDLTDPQELFLCFHYKNCQPLWGGDNMKKNNFYNEMKRKEYIENMKNEKNVYETAFLDVIHHATKLVDARVHSLVQRNYIQSDEQRKALYESYMHDQCLEAMQIMFFMNEQALDKKVYKATPLALMKNMESRKSGAENPRSKRVCQVSQTGNVLHIYESMNQAAKQNNTFHASISKCCSSPNKLFSSGGFHWCFEQHLDEVQHRCRWRDVMNKLLVKIPPFVEPSVKHIPHVSDETKEKIAKTMKMFLATDEGKHNKKQAHEKRSMTMQKQREEFRASMTEKQCKVCENLLPISMFCKKTSARDGLQPYCKPCVQLKKKKNKTI